MSSLGHACFPTNNQTKQGSNAQPQLDSSSLRLHSPSPFLCFLFLSPTKNRFLVLLIALSVRLVGKLFPTYRCVSYGVWSVESVRSVGDPRHLCVVNGIWWQHQKALETDKEVIHNYPLISFLAVDLSRSPLPSLSLSFYPYFSHVQTRERPKLILCVLLMCLPVCAHSFFYFCFSFLLCLHALSLLGWYPPMVDLSFLPPPPPPWEANMRKW